MVSRHFNSRGGRPLRSLRRRTPVAAAATLFPICGLRSVAAPVAPRRGHEVRGSVLAAALDGAAGSSIADGPSASTHSGSGGRYALLRSVAASNSGLAKARSALRRDDVHDAACRLAG